MKISRRTLLQFIAGSVATTAVTGIMGTAGAQGLSRPPGALTENEFLARCARCMRCLDVCQPHAIRPGHWLDGPRHLGTPILLTGKCISCMECIRICPTGALSKIPKAEVRLGTMVLDQNACLAWNKTRRCDRCFRACRKKAISMQERRYPVIDQSKCEACGMCVLQCPEKQALYLDPAGAKRYAPQPGRILTRLEDRVGPYEVAPPSYPDWFANRVRLLARHYGLTE
jgi:ferredoxin